MSASVAYVLLDLCKLKSHSRSGAWLSMVAGAKSWDGDGGMERRRRKCVATVE